MLFPLLRMSFPIAPSFWVLPGKHLPIFQVYSLVTSILKRLPNFPRLIDHSGFCGPFYKLLSQHLWSLFAHVFLSPYLDCELFIGKDIATVFFFCIFSLLDSVWHLLAHPCHILKLKLKKKDQAVLSWFTSHTAPAALWSYVFWWLQRASFQIICPNAESESELWPMLASVWLCCTPWLVSVEHIPLEVDCRTCTGLWTLPGLSSSAINSALI